MPFAESCITKLKKLGLPYANQSFDVEGCSIKVRIEPGHEYISIGGGDVIDVFSGIAKDGIFASVPAPTNTTFQWYAPTRSAWAYQLKKRAGTAPGVFAEEPQLAVAGNANQTASVYSGRLNKAAQIVLGLGKQTRIAGQLLSESPLGYTYTHSKCNGIYEGPDGKIWLLEIGVSGVFAMLLPVVELEASKYLKTDPFLKECKRLFGGIPTGAGFPTVPATRTAMLASGDIITLASADDVTPFYSKTSHNIEMGWSFNSSGSEAHNTCHYNKAGSFIDGFNLGAAVYVTSMMHSCHYKFDISISAINQNRNIGDPIATGTAVLSLVNEGPMPKITLASGAMYGEAPSVCAFSTYSGAILPMGGTERPFYSSSTSNSIWSQREPFTTPMFVCHINGVLDVVNLCLRNTSPITTAAAISIGVPTADADGKPFMSSTTFPRTEWTEQYVAPITFSHVFFYTAALFLAGGRDQYVFVQNPPTDAALVSTDIHVLYTMSVYLVADGPPQPFEIPTPTIYFSGAATPLDAPVEAQPWAWVGWYTNLRYSFESSKFGKGSNYWHTTRLSASTTIELVSSFVSSEGTAINATPPVGYTVGNRYRFIGYV